MKTLDAKSRELSTDRRAKVRRRAEELVAEEMTLRGLRKALNLTQKEVAATLGVQQEQVSRTEKRRDPRLSTVRNAVRAMGGDLVLMAKFPNRKPIELSRLASD